MSEASPWESTMRIGILGSGLMGGKLGTIFARAGHDVIFSYARSEEKLRKLAREAKGKARPGTPREAAQDVDAVLLAVHWLRFDDVLKQAGELSSKVVLTCSLPMNEDDTELVVGRTSSGAAALIGLQFIVVTLIAENPPPRAAEGGAAFATPTIVHFGAALFLSAVLRAPWQSITTIAAIWGLVGLAGLAYTAIVGRRMR